MGIERYNLIISKMENINKIVEAFDGEKNVMIVCSKELAMKLNQELANINTPESQHGIFKNENKIDLGFTSVFKNGVTLHYTSDFDRFIDGVKKMD